MKTTLGNTKKYVKTESETLNDFNKRKENGLNYLAHYTIISDLCYSFSFFLFILFYRYKSSVILSKYNEEKRDTSHYSVMLTGFPKDTVIDDKDLYDFFAKLRIRVHECVFARKYEGTLL